MIPERYAPMTYALFRIVFGFLFFCYGTQKMFGWFGGQVAPLASLQGAAGVIETVCGLLVMVVCSPGRHRFSPAARWRWRSGISMS